MANTLNLGNGNWAAKEGSLLAYNNENGNFKPLPFDFTRASSATRVNSQGLIEVVGIDQPRVDYSSGEGALLLEPSRTNSIPYSEDFSSWQGSDFGTLTGGQTGFDGSNNAWLYEYTSNNAAIVQQSNTSSGVQTLSVFAKGSVNNGIRLYAFGTSNANTYFDLNLGIVEGTSGTISNSIEDYGNGWYRCSMTFDQTNSIINLYLSNNSNSLASTGSAYIQYAQLEQGSYATSYIPTSGAAVTRVAEACNGAGNEDIFNDSEGVLFAEISAVNEATPKRISISDGTTNEVVDLRVVASELLCVVIVGGTAQATLSYSQATISDFNKIALKYKTNDFALWVNGFEVATDISGSTPSGLDILNFDRGTGTINFYGNCKDIRVYNTALTDEQLAALTTI